MKILSDNYELQKLSAGNLLLSKSNTIWISPVFGSNPSIDVSWMMHHMFFHRKLLIKFRYIYNKLESNRVKLDYRSLE